MLPVMEVTIRLVELEPHVKMFMDSSNVDNRIKLFSRMLYGEGNLVHSTELFIFSYLYWPEMIK